MRRLCCFLPALPILQTMTELLLHSCRPRQGIGQTGNHYRFAPARLMLLARCYTAMLLCICSLASSYHVLGHNPSSRSVQSCRPLSFGIATVIMLLRQLLSCKSSAVVKLAMEWCRKYTAGWVLSRIPHSCLLPQWHVHGEGKGLQHCCN